MFRSNLSHQPMPEASEPQASAEPSYAPFLVALGVTMIFWGIVTSLVMSAGGFVLFVCGLWRWISEIAQGWRK